MTSAALAAHGWQGRGAMVNMRESKVLHNHRSITPRLSRSV